MKKTFALLLAALGLSLAAPAAEAGSVHVSFNSYAPAPRVYYPPAYVTYPRAYYAPPVTVVRYARPVRAREYYVSRHHRGHGHRHHHGRGHW